MSTPQHIHPRRLFCNATPPPDSTPTGIDSSSCVRPSLVAQQERQASAYPLLAPSPSSPAFLCTHVEISAVKNDVENLVDLVNAIRVLVEADSPESVSADDTSVSYNESSSCPTPTVSHLNPLREGLLSLMSAVQARRRDSPDPEPALETPKNAEPIKLSDSHLLSEDLAHLRTIQKEVRGLFGQRSSPAKSTPTRYPASTTSDEPPQTATKISATLAASPERANETTELGHGGFSQLTLSPTTELFDRESVRMNPWFRETRRAARRSGSLPVTREDDQVVTSPISTIADISAAVTNREILADDESMTVMALQAAMARRRAPSLGGNRGGGTSDLAAWLHKQAASSKTGTSTYRRGSSRNNFPESSIYRN